MIALLLTNMGNSISEFAGIAASLEIFGISKYISVPVCAVLVWLLIVKGSYKVVEKVFLVACLVYIAYPIAAFMAGPDWNVVMKATVTPTFKSDSAYLMTLIGIVGTTIAPWMQFYQQAAVVEKGITADQYNFSRIDVIFGCIMAIVVAFFIDGRLRLNHPPAWAEDRNRRRCGPGAETAGRPVRLGAVRLRSVQRLALCRLHPAAFHGLLHLRRDGLGIGGRQGLSSRRRSFSGSSRSSSSSAPV